MLRSGTAQTTDMAHAMSYRWEFKYWIHPMLHEKKTLSAEYGAFYATQAGIYHTQTNTIRSAPYAARKGGLHPKHIIMDFFRKCNLFFCVVFRWAIW